MNWINPDQNLVGAVKQIQGILQGDSTPEATGNAYTLDQVNQTGFKVGFTDDECEKFYNHYQSQGWVKGNGLPITDLASQMTNWRNNPKQYEVKDDKDNFMRKVQEDVAARDRREGKGIMAEINDSGNITPDEALF
jgi:hypothetical protein